jgi:hypothetical protein
VVRETAPVLLGSPIACGRTAQIYPWGEGDLQVLKLFHTWFPEEGVHHEARVARAVHIAGLDVPAVGDVVGVDGRLGLVYERLAGVPMGRRMETQPWTLVLAMIAALSDSTQIVIATPFTFVID